MPLIRQFLQKFGYVKLADFGLLLDADERIVSVQESSLIDASGRRVVGWRVSDLGPADLPTWPGPASPGVATLAANASSRVLPAHTAAPAVAHAVAHVCETPDEDEWEWTIALARAQHRPNQAASLRAEPQPDASRRVAVSERLEMPRRNRVQPVPPPVNVQPSVPFFIADTLVQPVVAASSAQPTAATARPLLHLVPPGQMLPATLVTPAPPAPPAPPVRPMTSVRMASVMSTVVPARPAARSEPPAAPPSRPPRLAQQPISNVNAASPHRFPAGTEPVDPVALRAKLAQPLPPPVPRPRPRTSTLTLCVTRG